MLSRAPDKLTKVGRKVGTLLLLACGGALVGAVLGVFVSLVFPDRFTTIVAGFTAVFGLGLPLLSLKESENWSKHLREDPEEERARAVDRLARLRKPTWRGMLPKVVAALACVGVAVFLALLPTASAPHFIAAFLLLTIPGRVIRSVGGKWERIVGSVATGLLILALAALQYIVYPGLIPLEVLPFIVGWTALEGLDAVLKTRADYKLMKSPEFFEIT